jgi:hypothetical protein
VVVFIQDVIRNTIDTVMITVNRTVLAPSREAVWTTAKVVLIDADWPISVVMHALRMRVEMHGV